MQVPTEAGRASSGVGVTGDCESPDMAAGIRPPALCHGNLFSPLFDFLSKKKKKLLFNKKEKIYNSSYP